MDWLTFTAAVIRAVAWPLTALIIILVLRRPLLNLLPLLQQLRVKGIELEFGRRVEVLAADAAELPAAGGAAGALPPVRPPVAQLAEVSPRAAVLESWLEVRAAAVDALRRRGVPYRSRDVESPLGLRRALEGAGILDAPTLGVFDELRNLRNAAAHAPAFSIDPGSALDYARLAGRLAEHVKRRSAE
jgi:hypothetical protein